MSTTETKQQADTGVNKTQQEQEQTSFEPITSQEQLDKLITNRLTRERAKYADYEDLKTKAAKLDEIEQANKSELQKAQDALAAEVKARNAAETLLMRHEVAAEKGLDTHAAVFLQGNTREELEASATALTELIGSRTRVSPDPTQGRETQPDTNPTGDWLRNEFEKNK